MEEIKYMLVIKRMNNDYRPLPWVSLPSYNNEDLTTLLTVQISKLRDEVPDIEIGVYTNVNWFEKIIIKNFINVPIWIACTSLNDFASFEAVIEFTRDYAGVEHAEYLERNIVMWQYSFYGTIPGIEGNVDLLPIQSYFFDYITRRV